MFARDFCHLLSPLPEESGWFFKHITYTLCQFGWNWPCGFGEEGFKKLLFYFHYFLENGIWPIISNKLELPLPKDRAQLKFIQWFWNRLIFEIVNNTFTFSLWSPHWNKVWPFICANFVPLYPKTCCAKFGWNCMAQWFWRRRQCEKLTTCKALQYFNQKITLGLWLMKDKNCQYSININPIWSVYQSKDQNIRSEFCSYMYVSFLGAGDLPDFLISSRHPLGVQGKMHPSKSPRDSFPALDSWSL